MAASLACDARHLGYSRTPVYSTPCRPLHDSNLQVFQFCGRGLKEKDWASLASASDLSAEDLESARSARALMLEVTLVPMLHAPISRGAPHTNLRYQLSRTCDTHSTLSTRKELPRARDTNLVAPVTLKCTRAPCSFSPKWQFFYVLSMGTGGRMCRLPSLRLSEK